LSERVTIDGVDLVLAPPDDHESEWVDFGYSLQRLEAAWLRLSPNEPPLNPRIVGEPGLGKTTLACAAARRLGRPVYLFQCTMDTRPEDLIITPVLTADPDVHVLRREAFVYYSHYVPSARIHALARSHKVRLLWRPLGRLSTTLLARHRFWRQLWLSDSQWRALQARLASRTGNRHNPQPARAIGPRASAMRHPHKP
jgi:hypothetical protein